MNLKIMFFKYVYVLRVFESAIKNLKEKLQAVQALYNTLILHVDIT